jgi:hypothetical protein
LTTIEREGEEEARSETESKIEEKNIYIYKGGKVICEKGVSHVAFLF